MRSLNPRNTKGWLTCGNMILRCALGRSGIRSAKREGDGATPRGCYRFENVFYRHDKVMRPATRLRTSASRPLDGWCDATQDRNYNRYVRHPYPASAEHIWRADSLYDLVTVIDYNRRPRIAGRGSAIFMHVAEKELKPTEGCVALPRRDLLKVLAHIGPRSRIVIV